MIVFSYSLPDGVDATVEEMVNAVESQIEDELTMSTDTMPMSLITMDMKPCEYRQTQK